VSADRRFSVLMSVYAGEQAAYLAMALDSLCDAAEPPDEVVLVEDGPLGDALNDTIARYRHRLPIASVRLPVNRGLGPALNAGLANCKHALVARFDADDVSLPQRFVQQVDYLLAYPKVAAVGGWVEEFDGQGDGQGDARAGRPAVMRAPPCAHADIVRYATLRNPMNHPAVMFRRDAVRAVGGYQDDRAFEDYALWLRLLLAGHELANLPRLLVKMRAGAGQARRRSGWRYMKAETAFALKFRRLGFFSTWHCARFVLARVPLRLLSLPLLRMAYRRFARAAVR